MKIEQDQMIFGSIKQNLSFHRRRGKGHLFSYLKNRFLWHMNPRLGAVSDFPLHVDIEVSTQCNMSCPMCYRRTERFQSHVGKQLMEEGLFVKIIDECAKHRLFSVRLSLRGEPFLHPKIFEFIRLAKKAGIKEVSCLTNGLALTPEKFEQLVRLKFDWLTISFDGLGATYESIRKPANFLEAFEKIKLYRAIIKKHNSSKPAIRIQAIWPAIKDDPKAFYEAFLPYADSVTSNPMIDFLQADTQIEYNKDFRCPYLYQRLAIAADGKALLCPSDECGDYIIGEIKDASIYQLWHGEKLTAARSWFNSRDSLWWTRSPCKYCCYPRKKETSAEVSIKGRNIDVQKYINRSEEIPV